MSERRTDLDWIRLAAIAAMVAAIYSGVLTKLAYDWSTDENYSHGLLVPFVIAAILWLERGRIKNAIREPATKFGTLAIAGAIVLLIGGTLAAELFTQRISFVLMIGGLVIYLFGTQIVRLMVVPFALFLLAIPIPQILFNRIAMPLQTYASQIAVWGIRIFDVPTVRMGNVIDILPNGSTQPISLEVVEACSGIRSLMTLVTLALILGYFTRERSTDGFATLTTRDQIRTAILMTAAVPIAVITNAARVTATGVLTYHYGIQATDKGWHELSGWLVYVVALAILFGLGFVIRLAARRLGTQGSLSKSDAEPKATHRLEAVTTLIAILACTCAIMLWLNFRPEPTLERTSLVSFPTDLGTWHQKGSEIPFDASVDDVLRATDKTMREYREPDGRIANIYIGYYASQKTGATYHSPQNCLPGAGWVLRDPGEITITTSDGHSFAANKYLIQNGIYSEVMIYWYQGRGRTETSEYRDKMHTVVDSLTRGRTDGAMVRVMTDVGADEQASISAAIDLASHVADQLPPFIPN